jgi:hypothetical protein
MAGANPIPFRVLEGLKEADIPHWMPRKEDRAAINRLMRQCAVVVPTDTPQYFPLRNAFVGYLVSITRVFRQDQDRYIGQWVKDGNDIDAPQITEAREKWYALLLELVDGVDQWVAFENVNIETGEAVKRILRQYVDEEFLGASQKPDYTGKAPPSSPADTSAEGMGDDDLNTKVKKAKAENLARAKPRPKPRSSTHQWATYKSLLQHVDLLNPELPKDERRRRAKRLVQAYGRLRERRPKFHDDNEQLSAAFSIVNKVQYERRKAAKAVQKLAIGM